MFCQNCGNKLTDGAKFCPSCGNAVGASNSFTTPPTPQPAVYEKVAEPRWETRTVSVNPVLEYDCIQRHEAFGWEVYSTQDVKTVETNLRGAGNTYWTSTNEEKYTKLTFRRNKNMPYYQEIAALDEEYGNAEFDIKKPEAPKVGCLSVVCYLLGVLAFLFFAWGVSAGDATIAVPGIIYLIPTIIIFCVIRTKLKNHSAREKQAEENNEECRETMARCLSEVKQYID